MSDTKVLLIYTGGTIGMITDPETGTLKPFNFEQITTEVPELTKLACTIETCSFENPIDSSDMQPEVWVELVEIIEANYDEYDGFVVLHGSDTMAFTASAVSFMVQNNTKPIIFTGSQLPIGIIRTDGKENLITAIEVAATKENGKPIVPEVAIYFEYQLYRGNRTTKINAEHFEAFESFNYPKLAEAGIEIKYNYNSIHKASEGILAVRTKLDTNVAVLKLFPGISETFVRHFLETPGLRAVVIETFGSGNATSSTWFLNLLEEANERGIVMVNVTQCKGGSVNQGKYETGRGLTASGVVSGRDITFEAAITKLMLLLGENKDPATIKKQFIIPFSGEMSD